MRGISSWTVELGTSRCEIPTKFQHRQGRDHELRQSSAIWTHQRTSMTTATGNQGRPAKSRLLFLVRPKKLTTPYVSLDDY